MSVLAAQTEGPDNNGPKDQNGASGSVISAAVTAQVIPKNRKTRETLAGLVNFPLTDHQKQHADVKLFQCARNDIKYSNVL